MTKETSTKAVRVAVLLDAYVLGGSAKVVLSNLKHAGPQIDPEVVLFERGKHFPTEIVALLQKQATPFTVLKEKHPGDPRILFSLISLLRKQHVQVIESNHYKTHVLACCVSKILGIPWVATSHGWTSENGKMLLYNCLDRITLPWCSAAVALGPSISNKLKKILPTRVRPRCWPTAFDPPMEELQVNHSINRASLGVSEDEFIFGAIGRLSFEKGIDVLLDAFNQVRNLGVVCRLLIVGTGPEESSLLKRAQDLNLKELVLFVGQQTSSATQNYLSLCDALLIPSRSEGLPNVILEAAWMKVPVIASRVGGIPDMMVGQLSQWLFKSEEPKDLARLMCKMIEFSLNQRKTLAEALHFRLNLHYLAPQRARKVSRLYRALVRLKDRKER